MALPPIPGRSENVGKRVASLLQHFAGTFPGRNLMNLKQTVAGILMAASFVAAGLLMSSVGHAQDAKVKTAMELLRSMADK